MSKRPQKRRRRSGGSGASKKAQPGKLQADPTLVNLIAQAIQLDGEVAIELPGNVYAVRADLYPIAMAINRRCRELGGDTSRHIDLAVTHALAFAQPAAGGVH